MSEIRFLTSSDEHLSDQSPGFRKDVYRDSILSKIEWQGQLASRFNANAVLRGGDFFHVKNANRTSMSTLIDVMSIHKSYTCPTYSIIGNHDIVYNDITTLSRQPLGVLFESGVFCRLNDQVFESGSVSVRVIGIDYSPQMTSEILSELVKSDGHTYTIAVVHALAEFEPSQKTQSFFNEEVLDYRDLVFNGCPDVYVFGHYHKYQSIKEHLGVKFVNLGSISRGSLTIDNLSHKPRVALIKCNGSGISVDEEIVPHKDFYDIFDLDRKKQIIEEQKSIEVFLNKLKNTSSMFEGLDFRNKMNVFMDSNDFSDDEKNTVKEVFEIAESGGDI